MEQNNNHNNNINNPNTNTNNNINPTNFPHNQLYNQNQNQNQNFIFPPQQYFINNQNQNFQNQNFQQIQQNQINQIPFNNKNINPNQNINTNITTKNNQEKEEPKYNNTYISDETSTDFDEIESKEIEEILRKDFNLFESNEESRKREEVLVKLNELIKNFIYKCAIKCGMSEDIAKNTGGKIFTFGSYRLGVHGPGSDIDVLCVAPSHVERSSHFFGDLLNMLKREKDVTELHDVKDAHVPVIKMKYCEIQIDLLFAKLSYNNIDENLNSLSDDFILKNCDRESVLSLNGRRVTDNILNLVPDAENFRLTLRVIKLWSNNRGLYSNTFGYLGGVAWAILVAKVCQMFPKLKPNKLIRKFFEVYSVWDWSKEPVLLNEISEPSFNCPVDVFNPKQSKFLMAIVTPAFPANNSTYNTSETTKRILLKEFDFFKKFTNLISYSKSINTRKGFQWKDFFNEIDFFSYYSCFMQIDILSKNEEDHKKWKGFVESRLRILIKFLEDVKQIKIHPYPKDYSLLDSNWKFDSTFFFGVEFVDPQKLDENYLKYFDKESLRNVPLRDPVIKFCNNICEISTMRVGTSLGAAGNYIRNPETMNCRITTKPNFKLPNEILNRGKCKKFEVNSGNDDNEKKYEEIEEKFYNKKQKIY